MPYNRYSRTRRRRSRPSTRALYHGDEDRMAKSAMSALRKAMQDWDRVLDGLVRGSDVPEAVFQAATRAYEALDDARKDMHYVETHL